jgi:hypothetical protein
VVHRTEVEEQPVVVRLGAGIVEGSGVPHAHRPGPVVAARHLSEQVEDSGLALESLSEAERQSIENNIPASDLRDAQERVDALREGAAPAGEQGTETEEGSG